MTQNQEITEASGLKVPLQYGRVRGADWFPLLYKRAVLILGQGGIGSWAAAMLSRIGCDLYLYDHDRYEDINLSGQIVRRSDIGKNKAVAMKGMIAELSPDCNVETFGEYKTTSPTNDIVICGFDNMTARRTAFMNWKNHVMTLPEEERKQCFFQDGRLLAEVMQIISIPGDRQDLIEKYEEQYLFNDNEVVQEAAIDCTFKQTSHCAAMIASHMTGFLTNWAFNAGKGKVIRQVPFYFEYMIPLNMTTNEGS